MTNDRSLVPDPQHLTTDFTGWLLEEARSVLQSNEAMQTLALSIVPTKPPGKQSKASHSPIELGAWRVLRCRITEPRNAASEGTVSAIEFLIAREQVAWTQ